MSQSKHLQRILYQLADLSEALPGHKLSARARRQLAVWLFAEGPELTHHVAWILTRRPHLFPEIDARAIGEDLLGKEERAQLWVQLEDAFLDLAKECRDSALHEQATATRDACEICDLVIAGVERPLLGPQLAHRDRALALITALLYLQQARQNRTNKSKRKKTQETPRTPKQKKARAEDRQARLKAMFEKFLKG